ncbi:NAD(P)-binding protein [Aspergillus sclerotiicarbonarius CBS 121057]|uniref:D-xylose 1-dehydrogenase (NADP(+), D-xylono-1,5-lactone-forming) n=1 Tax=Aspergillus sclerotiicarbonarius (strain CBS 121057 / IBT 28362) TaxID=1448318 RepID=A0A319DTE2_ASPSB|nr:NAD(P)-binding protein [Aspergillus sclerotiicarbonarius CBS 121057]
MAAMTGRVYQSFNPPQPAKREGALRFGILGAAGTAPLSLIIPAKSHPEVIVQAVSARDRKRAEEFAKTHGIPEVKDSYEDILNDPNIDCIFVPLPNAFHYEWAVRAIRAGKNVLLEKPSVSNATEAESLFNLPELSQPNGPVLLEALHMRFYPALTYFRSLIDQNNIAHVKAVSMIPWWMTTKNDIHFNYKLSGGSMMSMGTYNFAALRVLFGSEPEECLSCEAHSYTDGIHDKCDYDFQARFQFPNGAIGEATSTMNGPTYWTPSHVTVTQKETIVPDSRIPESHVLVQQRELTLHGFIHGVIWHRIDIKDVFTIRNRDTGKVIKKYEEKTNKKAYSFQEAGGAFADLPGEPFWMSYRHQLEQFVNRIKGRETQHWISAADSIAQMKMVDMAYEKSGLGPRPSRSFE